ncbi:hypothetical protein SDJN02_07310, partial [Cucurbita argyrosperma subsp. argyrosperma]
MGYLQDARENHVKKKAEEVLYLATAVETSGVFPALRSKIKQKALRECDHYASRYAECVYAKALSVVFNCRNQA